MATLHLMVGLPGSGKTTLAKQLEIELGALRLGADEWHVRLFGNDVHDDSDPDDWARHDARHSAVEELLLTTAVRALELDVDAILDFGFWSRSERDELRSRAEALGAKCRIHATEASEQTLRERIRSRNAQLPSGMFHIPEHKLAEWVKNYEPPSAEELQG
jgi:predicted kinase